MDKKTVKDRAISSGAALIGILIWPGGVLTDSELKSDPSADYNFCSNCNL